MTEIRVLHVDDDPAFVDTARTLLEAADDDLTVHTELTPRDALEHLASEPVDCVVSDYGMNEQSGVEFLEAVRADHPHVPFVLFTGRGSESVASAAISAGVTDYLQKSLGAEQWTVLANRIENAVEAARDRRDLERRELQHEAVATLSRAALDGRPLDALVADAVDAVATCLDAPLVETLATTPEGDSFDVVASVGWEDADGPVAVDATGDSVLAQALATRDPVVFRAGDDAVTLPAHHAAAGVHCGAAIRIGPPDDPWGVLGAYDTDRRRATGQDRSFLQNVANVLETTVERRRADRERRETEDRFREIAELSPDTIFRIDPKGEFEWVSPAIETLLGYPPADLVGESFETVVGPGSLTDAVAAFQRVLDGETVRKLELRLTDAAGAPVDVEINASPVLEDGEVTIVQGLVRDVGERMARERELERKERAIDAAPIGIVLTDPSQDDNPIVYVNDHFESLTGYDEADVVGRNCRFLQGPDTDPEPVQRMRDAIDAAEPVSVDLLNYRQDGSTFWNEVTIAPIYDEAGDLVNFVGFQRDVTDRREREWSLQRFRQALEQAGSAIYITDPDRVIQYVNPAFEEITGYTAEEAVGATPAMLSADVDDDASPRDGWEHVAAGEAWTDTVVDERSTGERYTAVQTIAPITDGDEVTGYVAIQNDVSDQLLDRQRLSVLHRVIRHNLRNDQNLVMGTVELVMDRLDDPELEDSLQTVIERSETLLAETEKVRQVQALLNRDEYAATTVDEVLEGLTGVAESADDTDVTVRATTEGDETVVDVVERALAELLENAIEHTDDGTPVTVDVERDGDTHLVWTVSDHGPGLPSTERRVLERGTETPLEHSDGLGIWMANWLVQAAGGTISFEPNEPTGSAIHVRMPRVDVDG
jgi:PAS domain S-box-containing protein